MAVRKPSEVLRSKHCKVCETWFKELCTQLKSLKNEIEHLQHLLEKARLKLQSDFEEWWTSQSSATTNDPSSLTLPQINSNTNFISSSQSSTGSISKQQQIRTSTSNTLQHCSETLRHYNHDQPTSTSTTKLTGDWRTDEDIIAFYKARQKMIATKVN